MGGSVGYVGGARAELAGKHVGHIVAAENYLFGDTEEGAFFSLGSSSSPVDSTHVHSFLDTHSVGFRKRFCDAVAVLQDWNRVAGVACRRAAGFAMAIGTAADELMHRHVACLLVAPDGVIALAVAVADDMALEGASWGPLSSSLSTEEYAACAARQITTVDKPVTNSDLRRNFTRTFGPSTSLSLRTTPAAP